MIATLTTPDVVLPLGAAGLAVAVGIFCLWVESLWRNRRKGTR